MNGEYRTVFEVSHFSNGSLLMSLLFLCVGIGVLIKVALGKKSKRMNGIQRLLFFILWVPLWFTISCIWLWSNLASGRELTSALANNQCDIVEGTVQVLHAQPYSGHD